ncbi:MAG: 16S rRNA (cytidine(1402)-2'-O)-methyltransferase [Deltaproteobacteria bacterium]|nr:16S rRNA (cytidine(1402)-2'-O)-methyltransferase [Deltaproteobacteria bacterium]
MSRRHQGRTLATGTLYVVSTPIGNLEDITLRALRVLKEVDLIAAEDTRWTRKLLSRHCIHTGITSYHEHNKEEKAVQLVQKLREGKNVALVTDAGTPGVSDPGYALLNAVVKEGVPVCPVPGPSAAIAALSVAGLPTDRFCFEGFLPSRAAGRRRRLRILRIEPRTMIFFESPRRLHAALQDMREILGEERIVVVARELTKIHEEIVRGPLSKVFEAMTDRQIRGEITLLVSGWSPSRDEERPAPSVEEEIRTLMEDDTLGMKEIVAAVAQMHGIPKRLVYRLALPIRAEKDAPSESL